MRVGEIAVREPNWLHGLAMVRARDSGLIWKNDREEGATLTLWCPGWVTEHSVVRLMEIENAGRETGFPKWVLEVS